MFLHKLQIDSQKISHLTNSGKSTKLLKKYVQKIKTITKRFEKIQLFLHAGDRKVEKRSPWNIIQQTLTLIYTGLEKYFTVASTNKIQKTLKVHSGQIEHINKDIAKTKLKVETFHTDLIKHIDENLHKFQIINSTLLQVTEEVHLQVLLNKIRRYTFNMDLYISKIFTLIQSTIIPLDLFNIDHIKGVYHKFLINSNR